MNNNEQKLNKLFNKLSKKIGFYWWKRYFACSWWKNIETPINLSLTIFSTMISAQASTNNFMQQHHYVMISFATVLLTTFNTYFRPLQKYQSNTEELKKWYELGNELEKIYFQSRENDEEVRKRIKESEELLVKVNNLSASSTIENQNFVSDLFHTIVKFTCLKDREPWLSFATEDDSEDDSNKEKNKEKLVSSKGLFCCIKKKYLEKKSSVEDPRSSETEMKSIKVN